RALKQYAVCVDVLVEELGVAPSQETRTLYDRIEQQRAGIQVAVDWSPLQTAIQMAPLVNRDAECRVIEGCLDQMLTNRGCVLIIDGPAGIGKTRLVRELVVRTQQRGLRTLVGSSYEMEGSIAYGPFMEILQAALRDSPAGRELIPAEIASVLSGQMQDAQ